MPHGSYHTVRHTPTLRHRKLLGAVASVVVQEILVNGFAAAEPLIHAVPKFNGGLSQFPAKVDFHAPQEGGKIDQPDIQVLQHTAGFLYLLNGAAKQFRSRV